MCDDDGDCFCYLRSEDESCCSREGICFVVIARSLYELVEWFIWHTQEVWTFRYLRVLVEKERIFGSSVASLFWENPVAKLVTTSSPDLETKKKKRKGKGNLHPRKLRPPSISQSGTIETLQPTPCLLPRSRDTHVCYNIYWKKTFSEYHLFFSFFKVFFSLISQKEVSDNLFFGWSEVQPPERLPP